MRHRFLSLIAVLFALSSFKSEAQKLSLSTNLLDYACLGTINAEGSYSLSRYWSLSLGVEYNPFTFRKGLENQFQLRRRSCSLGARFWPWHIWSGWWMAGKIHYQEYNFGGIVSRQTEEGDRVGIGLCAGYTHMINPHWNIEFGLGGWTGTDWFRRYSCQECGGIQMSGKRWFILPDDILVALVYVF